jgi:hypothetical protein
MYYSVCLSNIFWTDDSYSYLMLVLSIGVRFLPGSREFSRHSVAVQTKQENIHKEPSLAVQLSASLTNHEVLCSIPGSTMVIFL